MENLSFYNLLSYGAIGLGCILAVLAYFLLRNEQDKPEPRKQILKSIYVYMAFSLVLIAFGFGAELYRDSIRGSQTAPEDLAALKAENHQLSEALRKEQDKLLMRMRADVVSELRPDSPQKPLLQRLVSEIEQVFREE